MSGNPKSPPSVSRSEIKIAYIGGGSKFWAPTLMNDLALSGHVGGTLCLYDIDHGKAQINASIGKMIFPRPEAVGRFHVEAVRSLRTCLQSADFVIISIEPGPIEMRFADLEIPAKYGIFQPVGDTTGPGGIVRSLRAVPLFADFAHAIMRYCPKAWVINYTNPMTTCVAALYAAEPSIKAFGCCHEVFGIQHRLARLVSHWFGVPSPRREDIRLDIAGINHFTHATRISWDGIDLRPYLEKHISAESFFKDRSSQAAKRKRKGDWFSSDGLISFDFFRLFGALGAAGDRHLAEFVPWYSADESVLHRWGVVLTPYRWRLHRDRTSQRPAAEFRNKPLTRSTEEGVQQIHALLGLGDMITNVNIPNREQMRGYPHGAVVETYALISRDDIRPLVAGTLPGLLDSLTRHIVNLQCTTLQAAMRKDWDLALQAIIADPLARLPIDKSRAMLHEMLEYCGLTK